MVQEAAGSSSEALPTVAEVLSTTTLVSCSLEACRRLVLDGQQVLLRVTHAPSGREPKLDALRGRQLLQVCSGSTSTDITPENTLENLLQLIDETGQAPQIDEVDLVFSRDEPDPMRKEVLRLKKNLLRDPDTPQTSLNANTLLVHLHPVGIRKRIVKELTQLPSGSCLYFSHSNWFLSDLGALLKLPPNKVKELDLSHNGIVHVGPELSRFEQMVDLRLPGNGIKEIDLHYLPRLKNLGLAFNKLQALPELAGLPALEELDLCDNEIGSRVSSEDMGSSGSSPDGWECLSHSDLQELKVLLLANNALAWTQTDFNLRIAILSEKPSIEKLDFRGNLMLFSPRLDDLPPLEKYREWILTHCKKLEFLDDEEILESDHLFLLVNPIIGEPSAGDDVAGGGDDDATDSQDPERMPVFGGVHQPRTADLNVLSSMLTETFVLPAHLASDTLDKVQRALSGLMAVPPTVSC
jgi:Leucine-rich repeat (LRR) protein